MYMQSSDVTLYCISFLKAWMSFWCTRYYVCHFPPLYGCIHVCGSVGHCVMLFGLIIASLVGGRSCLETRFSKCYLLLLLVI